MEGGCWVCLCVIRGGFAHAESVYVQTYVWERQSDGGETIERRLTTYLPFTKAFSVLHWRWNNWIALRPSPYDQLRASNYSLWGSRHALTWYLFTFSRDTILVCSVIQCNASFMWIIWNWLDLEDGVRQVSARIQQVDAWICPHQTNPGTKNTNIQWIDNLLFLYQLLSLQLRQTSCSN